MIIPSVSLERQAEALAKAQQHWQDAQQPGATARRSRHPWTIALTREAGTPGTALAREIGDRLGWPVYDRELVQRIAKEMGLRANLLEAVDERRKSWLIECVEAMTAQGPVSESKFVRHLVETLLSLSALGHCVIVGRGAAHILPIENTLRVRLVAAKADRITAAAKRLNLSTEEATRWVEKTDRERVLFVKEHFQRDPTDPSCYDLVLNASRWTLAECATFIERAVKELESPKPK